MAGLSDIGNALLGKPVQQDPGALNKKGFDSRPFPKQLNARPNAEAAAAGVGAGNGMEAAMHAAANKLHPVGK